MFRVKRGDLFKAIENSPATAIAHGCNAQRIIGKGFALEIRKRYPLAYGAYVKCEMLKVGDAILWMYGRPIFHLITQQHLGVCAQIDAIEKSCQEMLNLTRVYNITSIAAPKIGCGIGGLKWIDVQPVLQSVFADWEGTFTVYSLD